MGYPIDLRGSNRLPEEAANPLKEPASRVCPTSRTEMSIANKQRIVKMGITFRTQVGISPKKDASLGMTRNESYRLPRLRGETSRLPEFRLHPLGIEGDKHTRAARENLALLVADLRSVQMLTAFDASFGSFDY